MVDKITTVAKTKIGTRVGRLTDEDMVRLNRALLVFLGIAAPAGSEPSESSWLSQGRASRPTGQDPRIRPLCGIKTAKS